MVGIALLMIDDISENDIANAYQPILGQANIHYQILKLRKMGIERFILSVEAIDIQAHRLADDLKTHGIEVEFISTLTGLGDLLRSDDQFLMICDALWCDDKHIIDVINAENLTIAVVENVDENADFEIINAQYRWAGIAKLDGSIISLLRDLPDDSALQSSLLRLALQNNCPTKNIAQYEEPLMKIKNRHRANQISNAIIEKVQRDSANRGFFDLHIFPLISLFILRRIFIRLDTDIYLTKNVQYSPIILSLCAIIFALIKLPILSFAFLFLCSFSIYLSNIYGSLTCKNHGWSIYFIYIFILIALILNAPMEHYQIYLYAVAMLILLGLALNNMVQNVAEKNYNNLIFSFSDIFFLLMIASIFQIHHYAIFLLSIIYALWILKIASSKNFQMQ